MTVAPPLHLSDYLRAIDNLPSRADLSYKIHAMEHATWEATANIRTHMDVEIALARCSAACAGADAGASCGPAPSAAALAEPTPTQHATGPAAGGLVRRKRSPSRRLVR